MLKYRITYLFLVRKTVILNACAITFYWPLSGVFPVKSPVGECHKVAMMICQLHSIFRIVFECLASCLISPEPLAGPRLISFYDAIWSHVRQTGDAWWYANTCHCVLHEFWCAFVSQHIPLFRAPDPVFWNVFMHVVHSRNTYAVLNECPNMWKMIHKVITW